MILHQEGRNYQTKHIVVSGKKLLCTVCECYVSVSFSESLRAHVH